MFAYGPADATAIPEPHRLLPNLNPDWFYLFWYQLTQVVPEKRPINRFVYVCLVFDLLFKAVCFCEMYVFRLHCPTQCT